MDVGQALAELRWYKKLFEATREGILLIGPDNHIIFINRPGAAALGYLPEEMIDHPIADFLTPDELAEVERRLAKRRSGLANRDEIQFHRRDQTQMWALYSTTPLFDENNRYEGVLIVFTDITERKRDETKNTFLAHLLDSVSDAIITNDGQTLILTWNKAAENIYGYKAEEVIGKPIVETLHTEFIGEVLEQARKKVELNEIWQGEVIQKRKDGTPIMVYSSVSLMKMGEAPPIYVSVNRDITHARKIDEVLRTSEELFRGFADQSIDGIAIISEEGKFLEWNHGMEVITGYGREEATGRYFWDVQYELATEAQREHFSAETLKQGMVEALRTGLAPFFGSSLEAQLRRKDGQVRWIHQSAFPIRTTRGYRVGTIVRDVTNERIAELSILESETKYRTLFESLIEAVSLFEYILDNNGDVVDWRYLDANEAVARTIGRPRQDIIGKTVMELFGPEAMRRYLPIVREIRKTKRSSITEGLFQPVGLYSLDLFSPVSDENFIVSSLNISDRKKMELDLKRSNADLEQFAYVASHDLQEPIRMILSYVDLINRKYGHTLDPKAKEYFGYVVDGAERMRNLINDLLIYSRVGSAGREFADVDMGKVVNGVMKTLDTTISQSGAEITVRPMPKIVANKLQMTQLLQNLLGNALKFRGPQPLRIAIDWKDLDHEWVFSVEDNGIGIPKEQQDNIFKMFHRLHAPNEIPGTGMGLAISRKIVEQHGGTIWVESEEGKGSKFSFTVKK